LVGGYFPYIGNVIIPTDELIFFRGVYRYTTNQTCFHIFPAATRGASSSGDLRFYYLPKFALAAIVMNSVIPLVAFQEARHLFHVKKQDFLLWASWRWTAGPADFWEFS